MYCNDFRHSNSDYFDLEVKGDLPGEGMLKGEDGELRFRFVSDGIAVYDSTLLNSGFVYPGTPDDVFVPGSINGIPVTELHQNVRLKTTRPFAIENKGINRLFLDLSVQSLSDQVSESDNPTSSILMYLLRDESDSNPSDEELDVAFDFCGNSRQQVDQCTIRCSGPIRLHIPAAEELFLNAPKTVIRGSVPKCVRNITFSGKVFPYQYDESSWDYDRPNNHCFDGLENLEQIEGSLSGRSGWSFDGCGKLKSIHLSNGIEEIPAYAFRNCVSVQDLYIPDTVREIGKYAFSGCTSLQTIHLPGSIKVISEGMFQNCRSLTKVFLADTIEEIRDHAFEGCTSLKKPWIPKNIRHISESAFPSADW